MCLSVWLFCVCTVAHDGDNFTLITRVYEKDYSTVSTKSVARSGKYFGIRFGWIAVKMLKVIPF